MTELSSPAAELRAIRTSLIEDSSLTPPELRRALTDATDAWLTTLLGDARDVALVTVGGYGRREPAPGSDLDLLLVHREKVDVAALADSIWYPIWDSGIGLDHSVRTVRQAVDVAGGDLKAIVGMLDARYVAGDPEIAADLHSAIYALWRKDFRQRLPELVAAVRGRAERYGELAFLLEPELKESRGGLRDVNAMMAIAAAQVADAPDERARDAYAWLLDVRTALHRRSSGGRASRSNDTLFKQEQGPVAAALGAGEPDDLMRRVFEAGRTISFATDESCRRALAAAAPPRRWTRQRGPQRTPLAEGVVEQDGEVHLARDADPSQDPVLVLRVAAAAAGAGLPISVRTLQRLAAESMPMPQPWPEAARDALVATLGAGRDAIAVIESLDQVGLMVALMPEWANVRCKPQHNAVHRFTVDRHLVEAAAAAAEFTREVARPDLLLLGGLLHDIGKGFPGDHTDAGVAVVPVVGARLGLPEADVAILTTMVRHHLLLPDTATKRDLGDPATIETVTSAVGDRTTLELLYGLTRADAAATGPAAWNDWKAGLVSQLVRRSAAALAGDPEPHPAPLDGDQIAMAERGELAVDLTGSRLTIVAPDRPGLLWRWAAVLSLHRLEIRSANAEIVDAAAGRMAVTVFQVTPRFGVLPEIHALTTDVRRGYDDPTPIAEQLAIRGQQHAADGAPHGAAPAVIWVDGASFTASVVEVRAHDVYGLLYRLTRALADANLQLRSARIHTLGVEVVDTFYIAEADGSAVTDPARREDLEARLLAAC